MAVPQRNKIGFVKKTRTIKLKIQEKHMILTCSLMFSPEFNLEWELCKTCVLSWIKKQRSESGSMFCETNHFHFHITDSISFYFNFGKDHYFVLRVKQRIFGKAQIFQMNRVNPAIINWREENVETCARRSPSFKNFLGKKKYVR